ncbi:GNAT family N-acetyltransferase [Terrisporobacter sp.]|uniref:GNAT family N-acetyltransferase n=1 Tax=Terrisporobacter sp. TaxID=1965305 RepID=UPI00260F7112|nr:GNAT family N-acetyltransferase [Terrisporobacter sp.]
MEFRKSRKSDLNRIMEIIKAAQKYMKESGIDQWQDGYPNEDSITSDIESGESYVLEKDGKVIATSYLSFNGESDYNTIYEGEWINDEKYAVVHRVAVDNDLKGNGIAGKVFDYVENICLEKGIYDIKIDTHRHNKSMQRFLEKKGFKKCGIIYLKDNSERIAFEKVLKK